VTVSELFDDVEAGRLRDGVQCQDVQRLTHAAASFDLVTSTEVFEHVPDDRRAFAEVHRVLRPGGFLVFTVPLMDAATTLERARLHDGKIVHLVEPEYHGDHLRGRGRVLAFRTVSTSWIVFARSASTRGWSASTISPTPSPTVRSSSGASLHEDHGRSQYPGERGG
jgi:SAM-dependent methyltransferase